MYDTHYFQGIASLTEWLNLQEISPQHVICVWQDKTDHTWGVLYHWPPSKKYKL